MVKIPVCNRMKLVLLSVVNIALNACILYYLQNLERIGCICAMNYKRDYIYAYTIFSICFDIINAGTQGKISKYLEDKKSGIYIALILLLAGIINSESKSRLAIFLILNTDSLITESSTK